MAKTKKDTGAVIVPNKAVKLFRQLLSSPLHGEQSRARNRIYKIVDARDAELEKDRIAILDKYAKKETVDGKETYASTDDGMGGKVIDFPDAESREKANKEYLAMMDETLAIDVLTSNKNDLRLVKEVLKNSKQPLGVADGELYELILSGFEAAVL